MDVLSNSHMEQLREYLDHHPDDQFKARKDGSVADMPWCLQIVRHDAVQTSVLYEVHAASFSAGLAHIWRWLYENHVKAGGIA